MHPLQGVDGRRHDRCATAVCKAAGERVEQADGDVRQAPRRDLLKARANGYQYASLFGSGAFNRMKGSSELSTTIRLPSRNGSN